MTPEEKDTAVKEFVQITSNATLDFFYMMGMESHIEAMIINDANGDEFIFSFKKVIK